MKKRKLTHDELEVAFKQALRGMARLQARQEMLECVVRSVFAVSTPAHPLISQALQLAKQDMENRSAQSRETNPPETDADAMALWNVLQAACAPPPRPAGGNGDASS